MAARRRLDAELVRRGLAPSRHVAKELVAAARVLVNGSLADKVSRLVDGADSVDVTGEPPRFVGRGGAKLAHAIDTFGLDVAGAACLDAGASTGGFTDCLLQYGAASVVSIDVGRAQLHERLRADARVEVHEQTDIRVFDAGGRRFDVVVADLSFISLRLVMEALGRLAAVDGAVVVLVKPQFEAGRDEASRGRGIIRDPAIWQRVLGEVIAAGEGVGLVAAAAVPSPIRGGDGNVEFLVLLRHAPNGAAHPICPLDPALVVAAVEASA